MSVLQQLYVLLPPFMARMQDDTKLIKFKVASSFDASPLQWSRQIWMWQSQLKSASVGFGFCNLNPLDADLPRNHSLFHWIAVYWCLHILNTKSDDMSQSHLSFDNIQTSSNRCSMCICLLVCAAKDGRWWMMNESFIQQTVSPNLT